MIQIRLKVVVLCYVEDWETEKSILNGCVG